MRRTIVSWTVSTGDAPVSYWPICFPLPTYNRRKLRESYFCVVLNKLERLSLTLLYCERQYGRMKEKHVLANHHHGNNSTGNINTGSDWL